jgi:hypothetical protein
MSSWLSRLADLHGVAVEDLLGDLGFAEVSWDIDIDPPRAMLNALAQRTGVPSATLKAMTLSGWVPWLLDELRPPRAGQQDAFDTYVRANPVLLAPGEAGAHRVDHLRGWQGPWRTDFDNPNRACPACAAEKGRGAALLWRLPLMAGCAEHGCYLEDAIEVRLSVLERRVVPRPVPEPLATLDRYTHAALVTGSVELPGRSVHAGVWFRLLRSLLDEVSLPLSGRRTRTRDTLENVWAAAELLPRCGITSWRPYELLDSKTREAMMLAAATALRLAASRDITARGRLASAVQPPTPEPVYDGDPRRAQRSTIEAEADALMAAIRTSPDDARQLLTLLTGFCRTLAGFDEQRDSMIHLGVPAAFLPTAVELGRTDLVEV